MQDGDGEGTRFVDADGPAGHALPVLRQPHLLDVLDGGREDVRGTRVAGALHGLHPHAHAHLERRLSGDERGLVALPQRHRILDVLDPPTREVAITAELDHDPVEARMRADADVGTHQRAHGQWVDALLAQRVAGRRTPCGRRRRGRGGRGGGRCRGRGRRGGRRRRCTRVGRRRR